MPTPWSVTTSSMTEPCARAATVTRAAVRAVGDGVLDQVAEGDDELIAVAADPKSVLARELDLDALVGGVDADPVDRPRPTTFTDTGSTCSSGSSPWSRDSSMICWTRRLSRSLSIRIREENRSTAAGSSAASATASASRVSAPIGVFSS